MIDLEEEIARIDRQQEEFRRFAAEQHKLMAEQYKFNAEAAKMNRDRFFPPWLMIAGLLGYIVGLIGGTVGIVSAIATFPR